MERSVRAVYVEAGEPPPDPVGFGEADVGIDLTVERPEDALELVEDEAVDCVVCDHDPPEVDSLDVLEEVRELSRKLPFVLYVSDGSEELASEAFSADADGYVRRDEASDGGLLETVEEAVERYRRLRDLERRDQELRKYRNMVHSMIEPACIYDEDKNFDTVNEYLADWFGTTREELEGTESTLVPMIEERHDCDVFGELLEGDRQELRGEVEGEFPNHGHAVIQYLLTPLESNGDIEGVVGVTRDVTGRRERERELRETKERLDLALESTNTGIWEWDLETDEVVWDDTLEHLLGLEPGEFEGTLDAFFGRVHPDDRETIEENLQEAIQDDDLYEAEFRIRHEDGGVRWSASRGKLVDGGDSRRMIGVYQDITERKEHEERLERQNQRLEEFASVVSHDLRNPLHVAKGRLELARDECETEHHDDIEGALDRMQQILEDVLWLAREGRDKGEIDSIELEAAVERCWRVDVPGSDDHELVVDEVPETVEADRDRLRQMLQNLLSNAVEHGGDDVTVEVGALDDAEGFYVEDDGSGVPEDKRDEVFEVGYSTSDEGTGFGLRIVERVAEAHGWSVRLTEGDAGGARFEVEHERSSGKGGR